MSEVKETKIVWNLFGSETSIDADIMVVVDKPLSKDDSHKMCNILKTNSQIKDISKKNLNINIAVVKDSTITWVFKGTPDETNNSIFNTYKLHEQKHKCIVGKLVPRDINTKIVRSIRVILTTLTRTELRKECKTALRTNTIDARLKVLELVDFTKLTIDDSSNTYKTIAFQIGQTIALINGSEIYTKTDVGKLFPKLIVFLERNKPTNGDMVTLTDTLRDFISIIKQRIVDKLISGNMAENLQ